jgi:hypothetical protein
MVSDEIGGYHGRAELGLLSKRDQGGVSVCWLRMGPREGGKGSEGLDLHSHATRLDPFLSQDHGCYCLHQSAVQEGDGQEKHTQ